MTRQRLQTFFEANATRYDLFVSIHFAQDCQDSLQNSEPEIKFALEYGEQLIDDDLTDPEDKEKIHGDVKEMGQALKDLKEEAAKEKIRYCALTVLACSGEGDVLL